MSERATNHARRQLLASGLAAAVFAVGGGPGTAGPRSGGRLRAALSGGTATDSWDPRTHQGAFMLAAGIGCLYEGLTEIAADGGLKGELAVDWSVSADGRDWRFVLREGVRFHDGQSLRPRDVIASLTDHPTLPDLAELSAPGPREVRLMLERGDANLPLRLADPRLAVHPEGGAEAGIGTGPFRAGAFEPGRRFLGRRNAEHWGDGAFVEEVELFALDPASRRMAALRTGRVDAIDALDDHAHRLLSANAEARVLDVAAWRQAVSSKVATPARIGATGPMDDLRFARRWWLA